MSSKNVTFCVKLLGVEQVTESPNWVIKLPRGQATG